MHFTCESCKASLNIADEKVKGKRLVVRCKRCDSRIQIADPALGMAAVLLSSPGGSAAPAPADPRAPAPAARPAPSAGRAASAGPGVAARVPAGSRPGASAGLRSPAPRQENAAEALDETDAESTRTMDSEVLEKALQASKAAEGAASTAALSPSPRPDRAPPARSRSAAPEPEPEEPAAAPWFAMIAGKQEGPLPRSALEGLASSGVFGPRSYVWTEGMAGWVRAGEVSELAELFEPLSRPPQPAPAARPAAVAQAPQRPQPSSARPKPDARPGPPAAGRSPAGSARAASPAEDDEPLLELDDYDPTAEQDGSEPARALEKLDPAGPPEALRKAAAPADYNPFAAPEDRASAGPASSPAGAPRARGAVEDEPPLELDLGGRHPAAAVRPEPGEASPAKASTPADPGEDLASDEGLRGSGDGPEDAAEPASPPADSSGASSPAGPSAGDPLAAAAVAPAVGGDSPAAASDGAAREAGAPRPDAPPRSPEAPAFGLDRSSKSRVRPLWLAAGGAVLGVVLVAVFGGRSKPPPAPASPPSPAAAPAAASATASATAPAAAQDGRREPPQAGKAGGAADGSSAADEPSAEAASGPDARASGGEVLARGPSESPLTAEAVRQKLDQNKPSLQRCIEEALRRAPRDPKLRARRLYMLASVAPSGAVTSVRFIKDSLPENKLATCLKNATRRIVFPAFSGAPRDVQIPIDVTSGR